MCIDLRLSLVVLSDLSLLLCSLHFAAIDLMTKSTNGYVF